MWPSEVPSSFIDDYVTEHHHESSDLDEGDLLHRIDRFDRYVLRRIPLSDIDLDEWYVDAAMVDDYAAMTSEMPPIVFDSTTGSVIDGIHRANAVAKQGGDSILAYVGETANLNPHWSEDGDVEDDE